MTQVKVNLKWKLQITPEELRRYLSAQKRLKPYALVINAKHAEYLEFGTGPAQHREGDYVSRWNQDGTRKKDMVYYKELYNASEFYRAIVDWVRRKAGPSMGKKAQYEFALRVYGNIARNGMRARPYFRPSFYYMCEHMQQWFDEGYSTKDIITAMEHMVERMVMHNPNAPPHAEYMPDTGALLESMHIMELNDDEVERAKVDKPSIQRMSDGVWEEKSKIQGKYL